MKSPWSLTELLSLDNIAQQCFQVIISVPDSATCCQKSHMQNARAATFGKLDAKNGT